MYDWDFCEAIAYIIDSTFETFALYMWVSKGADHDYDTYFKTFYKKKFDENLPYVTSNLNKDL